MRWCGAALALTLMVCFARADLKQVEAEPNLERRSQLALANAEAAYKTAREAYDKGENSRTEAALAEVLQSIEIAYTSLKQTGKDPRKNPKWFKKAELQTRELGRKIDSFQDQMSFSDRPMADKLKARVQQIHDDLLLGLMEGKRKK